MASSFGPSGPPSVRRSGFLRLLAGCFNEYNYRTEFTPGFVPGRHRVSILGVFRDGRMDFESWDELAPALSTAFDARKCPAGYRAEFVADHGALSAAIDDVARSDGLGDDLLAQLSPAAAGDLIIVFTIAGRVEKAHIDIRNAQAPQGGGGMTGGQGGAGGAAGALGARIPMAQGHKQGSVSYAALDLSATLFSVSLHSTVGVVDLEYTGENAKDAVAQFAAKVRATIPGSTCDDWNWSVPIDEHRVRELVQQ